MYKTMEKQRSAFKTALETLILAIKNVHWLRTSSEQWAEAFRPLTTHQRY